MLRRGIEKASKGVINKGGHSSPVSIFTLNLKLKKAQKKEKKKRTSLLINHPIDHFKEDSASIVWCPNFPSQSTSFAHKIKIQKAKIKFKNNQLNLNCFQQNKTKQNKKLKTAKHK